MKKVIAGVFALFVAAHVNAAVVATVDGQDVTDEEVNRVLFQATRGQAANYENLNGTLKKQLIDQVIEQKLLTKQAFKNGIEKDADYQKALAQAKNDIALQTWLEKEFSKFKITDEQVKKYYDDNSNTFPPKPESWTVSHILVKDEATAKKVIKELSGAKDLPAKFAEAAAKYSEDNVTKTQGGALGVVTKNTMFVEEFLNATFALKKGEITKTPVKTIHGYHVIYVTDKSAEGKYTFDEVKNQIIDIVTREEFQKNLKSQAQKLKDKAKIEIK
ncbi:MAG: peptidylprolyl isomerase [Campylobacteraceae bacterium]|jgi:parvulin-like peptidyl-prolyl isomerase|nr:peptidylprolyl isomerase [Campylobacteraceae bacterium]